MKFAGAAILCFASLLPHAAAAQNSSPLENGLFEEVNQLRTDPPVWAGILKAERPWSPGKIRFILGDDETAARTEEAIRDLEEAIAALESVHGSLSAVELSAGLAHAAADHVRNTGSRGLVGHRGADGSTPSERIQRYGTWYGQMGENIVYSTAGARELIFQQLVDFGVENRGHRLTLLNPAWHYVGIACGPHAVYHTMCVLDFASSYQESIVSRESAPGDRPGKHR